MTLNVALTHSLPDYYHVIQTITTGLVLGIGWLLPAIFAGASALFGGISKKKQRDETNRINDQRWAQYQTQYRSWIDQQNRKRALLQWYANQKGWTRDSIGTELWDNIFKPLDYSSIPGGAAPHDRGSFWGDVLGQALGAVPGLILQYKGPKAPTINPSLLSGVGSAFGGPRGIPGTDFDPYSSVRT